MNIFRQGRLGRELGIRESQARTFERRSAVGGVRAAEAGTKSDEKTAPSGRQGKNTCCEAGDVFSTRGEVEPWGGDAGRTWGVAWPGVFDAYTPRRKRDGGGQVAER